MSETLGSISEDIRYGFTESASAVGTHRFIRITDITNEGKLKTSGIKYVSPDTNSIAKYKVEKGDLLIARSGSVGRPLLIRKAQDAVFASYLIRFRINPKLAISEYVFYFVSSPQCQLHIAKHGRGAAIKNINAKQLGGIPIPLPSLSEQRRIVERVKECLTQVDEVEHLCQVSREEAKDLTFSLYSAVANTSDWPSAKIGELVTRSRNGKSIRQDNENGTGFVLSLKAVHDVTLDLKAKKPVVLSDQFAAQFGISKGDVFVSRSNTRELVGLSSVASETPAQRLIYPDLLIKLEVDRKQIMPRFLAYALRAPHSRMQIRKRSVGTSQSMVKISGARLKEVEVPVPSLVEQEGLIDRFDEVHGLSDRLQLEIESSGISLLRDSILHKAFAGEL